MMKQNPKEPNSSPFIIKDPTTLDMEQIDKERKTMGFFSKAFNNI